MTKPVPKWRHWYGWPIQDVIPVGLQTERYMRSFIKESPDLLTKHVIIDNDDMVLIVVTWVTTRDPGVWLWVRER